MDHGEAKTPTRDLLASFVENLQQPNARLCVGTPNNLGSEDVHYTSSEVFPLIVTAVNAHADLMNAAQAAVYALKSYEYGNSSPDLAQGVVVALEAALKLARAET